MTPGKASSTAAPAATPATPPASSAFFQLGAAHAASTVGNQLGLIGLPVAYELLLPVGVALRIGHDLVEAYRDRLEVTLGIRAAGQGEARPAGALLVLRRCRKRVAFYIRPDIPLTA
jgi:hypothetical protein